MKRGSSGISFIEIIFVVLLLGIMAAITVPRFNMSAVSKQTAKTFSRQITADLRYTRQLALTHAAGNPQGYQLMMTGSGSYTGYTIQNRQTGESIGSYSINPDIQCTGDSAFPFGPLGNVLSGGGNSLQVAAGEDLYSITVIPATGSALCQKN